MYDLKNIAWKLCRAAKIQVIIAIQVVALAVCLIATMLIYVENARTEMEDNIRNLYGDVDISAGYNLSSSQESSQWITKESFNQIKTLEEVELVEPILLQFTSIDKIEGAYTLGVTNGHLTKGFYHLNDIPKDNEVIISHSLSKTLNKSVTDSIMVNGKPFLIKGVLSPNEYGEDAPILYMDIDSLKIVSSIPSDVKGLFVMIKTTDVWQTATVLHQFFPNIRVDITKETDWVQANLNSLLVFIMMLVFSIIIISGLLLKSTFSLLFSRLQAQFFVLRTMGATTGQLKKIVNYQSTIILLIGVGTGTISSLLLLKFVVPSLVEMVGLPQAHFNIPVVYFSAILLAIYFLLYMFVFVQVARVTKILPLAMKRNYEFKSYHWTKWKTVLTFIVGVMSLLILAQGILQNDAIQSIILIFTGSVCIIGCLFFLFPYMIVYTLKKYSSWIHRYLGNKAHYVKIQFIPNLSNYVPVVCILAILIMIITFNGTFLKSIVQSEETTIEKTYPYEVAIDNPYFENISYNDIELLRKKISIKEIQLDSKGSSFLTNNGVNLNYFAKDFGGADRVEITDDVADKYDLKIGDVLEGDYLDRRSNEKVIRLRITGIVPTENKYKQLFVDWNSPLIKDVVTIDKIHLTLGNGTTLDDLQQTIHDWPTLKIVERAVLLEQASEWFYQRWAMFMLILTALVVASCTGLVQTIFHIIFKRRDQYNTQRLIGLAPKELKQVIWSEVLFVVTIGLLLGLTSGMFLTKLIMQIDADGPIEWDFLFIFSSSIGTAMIILVCCRLYIARFVKRSVI
ncbi:MULTISPECIES: ABC transporter permease [Lysinibacillus]|uniref:ABC transporter permease n=1 Tax=Lysinibacillus TaxID=400634 RepID=UPI0021A53914|nr:ABC transporter permease [Lysinibacillus capsici]MCT1541716.1 ABC transporter permease [Lysinibacillus capsici]MCT1572954.1 ABC transporter permease [Lysinibacillus capsici]MCT1648059.1 ABC transporter permease [Lysinibacillus capsici]MCT1726601.1 ABC transporter permease [Lysinibacillus capsici]MCT1783706.1 ABC transporter permease [Lysinibacillus capsici]